jgi:putative membrane protein
VLRETEQQILRFAQDDDMMAAWHPSGTWRIASDLMAYLLTKTAHLVFVMAWMGGVFYLPRILVNIAEAGEVPAVRARLVLMGRRLYRFGHMMFGIAVLLGLALWLHFGITGGWLHAKLLLVLLMMAHYTVGGRWLKGVDAGKPLPSAKALRWFNEVPVLLLVAIVYLVLAKPF